MIFDKYIEDYIKENNIEGHSLDYFGIDGIVQGDSINIEENEIIFLESIEIQNPITFFTNDSKIENLNSLNSVLMCTGFIEILSLTGTANFRGVKLSITSYKTHSLVAITDKEGKIEELAIKEN